MAVQNHSTKETIRWHDLRHFTVSLWIEKGFSIKEVMTFAGHSSIQMTMECYGHLFPIGTFDTFTTYGGPANLLEAANTIGMPLYARQHLDEKGCWIDLMTEASILPVNKRPRLAIRLFSSN